ncbi:hypothetical protein GVO57_09470 [Sphingomonas changnyeongensis]|uniref:Putative auto-transporter adhesin head GIN domain-containing protein n=1 Tax=Sphingomonas changnyeongensis TaxID=2698679 RepID=A0A7Z2NWV7_9SPHN|nr:DUF2807 domain-containing protein [Sphingomonas changnyeongensis]QHL91007.1 hypothetical protein GVO57_09470 [Sphingomonas changnyeongensis]
MLLPAALAVLLAGADGAALRDYPVAGFEAVDLAANAMLTVEQGAMARVAATGDARLLRCLTATVVEDRLVIGWAGRRGRGSVARGGRPDEIVVTGRADCPSMGDPGRLHVRVTAPTVTRVRLIEQGRIDIGPLSVPGFAVTLAGRGQVTLRNLRAAETRLALPGQGGISAAGTLGRLVITLAGRGTVDTTQAQADSLSVTLAGGGGIAARVDGPAAGTVAGSGQVAISGQPVCAIRNVGKARIICPAGR